jgi:hypothetical protein
MSPARIGSQESGKIVGTRSNGRQKTIKERDVSWVRQIAQRVPSIRASAAMPLPDFDASPVVNHGRVRE